MAKTMEEIKEAAPIIYQYVRDKNGRKIGIVLATGSGKVGWSICKKAHEKLVASTTTINEKSIEKVYGKGAKLVTEVWLPIKGDKFNLDDAFAIAFKKANQTWFKGTVPCSIKTMYDKMLERSRSYFDPEHYSKKRLAAAATASEVAQTAGG